jgi:serine/threonine-protein kinase RsbW
MTNAFRMTIGADRGEVARVNAAFAAFADRHALPAPVRRSVNVVLDELLTNTIAHGFAGGRGGEATVELELQPDRVSLTLTDDGPPFNPFGTAPPPGGPPNPALPVEQRSVGGLGIHLVRRMMDEVSYERRADRNVVVLAKLLSGGRSLDITTRTQNDVTIVAFAGKLDSTTSPLAQQALDAILAAGGRKIVVDFTELDYISSAGLRVLLAIAKRLRTGGAGGGALRLFGLNETVREVFQISGFSTILAVFATEDEALDRLS